jgi:hypothetical protein
MRLILAGGNIAQRLLRNRGKLRKIFSRINEKSLRRMLKLFVSGEWVPSEGQINFDYSICLTSWHKRLDSLPLTLISLIRQNIRPQYIYVWLAENDFHSFPNSIAHKFSRYGVIFKTCPDYRSHKKWLPMVLSGRTKPFVVCDDDIIYPSSWFGNLISEDRADAYVGCKCHRITLKADGSAQPYAKWVRQVYRERKPSHYLMTTGCGGEILHPNRILPDFLDWGRIQLACPKSDDIWLKAAHLEAGIPVYKTKYCFPCLELPGTDASGLALTNDVGAKDIQIEAMGLQFKKITNANLKNLNQ